MNKSRTGGERIERPLTPKMKFWNRIREALRGPFTSMEDVRRELGLPPFRPRRPVRGS